MTERTKGNQMVRKEIALVKRIILRKELYICVIILRVLLITFIAALALTGCSGQEPGEEATDGDQINPEAGIWIKDDGAGEKFITGKRNNKETFQVPLPDYFIVSLNRTDFYDMTGDSREEMCVGLNIGNDTVSDINAIHVFDSITLEQLFPTRDKSSIYQGKIVRPEEDGFPEYAIDYESFSKVQSIAFTEEKSLAGWKDDSFVTLRYHKKLMALEETCLTAVYLEDYSRYEKAAALKFTVEKIGDDELGNGDVKVQDIAVELGTDADWTAVDRKIVENDLVFIEDWDGDGNQDIVIRPFEDTSDDSNEIVYIWDDVKKLFAAVRDLETIWKEEVIEEEKIDSFLSGRGFPPGERPPAYRRLDEEGNVQIEFYYDERTCSGAGYRIAFSECTGFWFEGYSWCSWRDEKFSTEYNGKTGADSVEDYEEWYEYDALGRPVLYRSEGELNWLKDKPGRYPVIEIRYDYREDGTLRKRDYYYNPYIFGTTNSTGMSCYDALERLEYNYSYITHGSVEKYYIYEGKSTKPKYCLKYDNPEGGCFIKYK